MRHEKLLLALTAWLGLACSGETQQTQTPGPALYEACYSADCQVGFCTTDPTRQVAACTVTCEADDCPEDGVCVIRADATLGTCVTPCTASVEGEFACVDGRPVLCEAVEGKYCETCGCASDQYCSSNGSCIARGDDGETCSADDQCVNGRCCGDVCAAIPASITGPSSAPKKSDWRCPGETAHSCGSDSDCDNSLTCSGSGRGYCTCPDCEEPLCLESADCEERYSAGVVCAEGWGRKFCLTETLPGGETCLDDSWCESGDCREGICFEHPTNVSLNGFCESNAWCKSNYVCCSPAAGKHNLCTYPTTFDTCRGAIGDSCEFDMDCISGNCVGSFGGVCGE